MRVLKLAFSSIPYENVVFAIFFVWWVVGTACKPIKSWDFGN